MSGSGDLRGVRTARPAIASYLASYESDLLGRGLSPHERMWTEEVLLDYLLDEAWLDATIASSEIGRALDSLRKLVPREQVSTAARIGAGLLEISKELEGRLARQQHLNAILRERLAALTTPAGASGGA